MIGKVTGLSRFVAATADVEAMLAQDTDCRIGVLLAQLGTPDAPTPAALRRYLRQFLGDPRVVERNRVLWWFVLQVARVAAPAAPVGCALSAGLDARGLAACSSSRDRRRARSKPSSIATSRNDSRSRWACATAVPRSRRPYRELHAGGRTGCCCFRSTPSTQAQRRDRPTTRCSGSCRCCGSCRHSGSFRPYYDPSGLYRGARRSRFVRRWRPGHGRPTRSSFPSTASRS